MSAKKPSLVLPPERCCRLLLRLPSPRTGRRGGEAWLPWAKPPQHVSRLLVCRPLVVQRAARPHACAPVSHSCSLRAAPSGAPVSAAAPPQRLQLYKRFCSSLFKLSSRLNQSPPAASPSSSSRAGSPSPATRPVCALRRGRRLAGDRQGVRRGVCRPPPARGGRGGRWKRPFNFPILPCCSLTSSSYAYWLALRSPQKPGSCSPALLLMAGALAYLPQATERPRGAVCRLYLPAHRLCSLGYAFSGPGIMHPTDISPGPWASIACWSMARWSLLARWHTHRAVWLWPAGVVYCRPRRTDSPPGRAGYACGRR